MSKKFIDVMDTSFRDGMQSSYGARVLLEDYLPAIESAVHAGITHFEVGGGALFQSPLFYCNQNPFDIMDKIRATVGPTVNLQTLARGVNVVGLQSQPRDIIDLHAKLFKKHGMTTIRNFDALNDVDNLVDSGLSIHNNGLEHEVTITMMELPPGCEGAHDVPFYERVLRNILEADIPFVSLAFKDASGTSNPRKVYETIRMARKILGNKANIRFHSHDTAGTAMATYFAALEGGANGIDLAMQPVSGGTGQPDIISLWHSIKGTKYDLGVNIERIVETEEIFKECMKDYFLPPEALAINPLIVFSPMPGGALTANTQMMRDNGTLDKLPDVIAAMRDAVEKGGFGTSVTPVSQFYIQQAFINVFSATPWEKINEDYGKMVLGYYGKTPSPPDPRIVKLASEQLGLKPTNEKVVDINERDTSKGVEVAKNLLKEAKLEQTEENIFIAATCGAKGIKFLKGEGELGIRKNTPKSQEETSSDVKNDAGVYTVNLNGKEYAVEFANDKAIVNGKSYDFNIKAGSEGSFTEDSSGSSEEIKILAAIPGLVLQVLKKPGDIVAENETMFIVEAMKMETELKSPKNGTVLEVKASQNDKVSTGQLLAIIK